MIKVRVKNGIGRGAGVQRSARTRQVAKIFGLSGRRASRAREDLEVELAPGSITLLTGASGAGKSTLLRRIEARLRHDRCVEVLRPDAIGIEADRAVVDCFNLPLEETMGILSRAGLAEGRPGVRAP